MIDRDRRFKIVTDAMPYYLTKRGARASVGESLIAEQGLWTGASVWDPVPQPQYPEERRTPNWNRVWLDERNFLQQDWIEYSNNWWSHMTEDDVNNKKFFAFTGSLWPLTQNMRGQTEFPAAQVIAKLEAQERAIVLSAIA
eukprot:scaffold7820_cov84-Cylindrotheca_fusiformis.AAC.1